MSSYYPKHGADFESCAIGTQAELVRLREEVTALRLTNGTLKRQASGPWVSEDLRARAEKAEAERDALKAKVEQLNQQVTSVYSDFCREANRAEKAEVVKTKAVYVLEIKQTPEGWQHHADYGALWHAKLVAADWRKLGVETRIGKYVLLKELKP